MYALLFFFSSRRRHTRYASDWSSDVGSSDLVEYVPQRLRVGGGEIPAARHPRDLGHERLIDLYRHHLIAQPRSEERRVGKECRSRWSAYHSEKTPSRRTPRKAS